MNAPTPIRTKANDREQKRPAAEQDELDPLPEKARAAFEAIGVHIHEPTDDAPLLARWQRAVA